MLLSGLYMAFPSSQVLLHEAEQGVWQCDRSLRVHIQAPEAYFPIGLTRQKTEEGYFYLTATPEKALCDLIVSSSNLHIQSMKTMRSYLNEYLRADWDMITGMDISIIRACAEKTNKKKN